MIYRELNLKLIVLVVATVTAASTFSGCAKKAAATAAAAAAAAPSADDTLKTCLVGTWTQTKTDPGSTDTETDQITYTAGNGFVKTESKPGSNKYAYYSGVWTVTDGYLNLTYALVGNSSTSIADAATSAAAPSGNGGPAGSADTVACSGSHYGTDLLAGGDTSTLVGTWKSSAADAIQFEINSGDSNKSDIADEIASVTLALKSDGTGSFVNTDDRFENGGTWSTTPNTSNSMNITICSWKYTASTGALDVTLDMGSGCSSALAYSFQALVAGSSITNGDYYTKQ